MSDRSPKVRFGGSRWGYFLLPWSVALVFLTWRLDRAILAGDELHLVRALAEAGPWELMTTYRPRDHCLPLSGFFSLLLAAGVPLGSLGLRVPGLLAYLVFLIGGSIWIERRLGHDLALGFAWLAATSPLALLYGRIVRPYVFLLVLVPLSLFAFLEWLQHGRRRALAAHAAAGALAVYFHPVVLPMVFAPGLLFPWVWSRSPARGPRALLAPLATGLACLSFLVSAFPSLIRLTEGKAASPSPSAAMQWHALETLLGSPILPLALGLAGLCWFGWTRIRLDWPELWALALASSAAQLVGLWVLRPQGFEVGIQYARYLIGLLPWILLGVAGGWNAATRGLDRRWRALAGLLLLAAIVAGGPLVRNPFLGGSFAHHKDVIGFYSPPARLVGEAPEVYAWITDRGSGPVIEAPGPPGWRRNTPFYVYQALHGNRTLLAFWGPALAVVELHNSIPANDISAILARNRYLVLHRDLGIESEEVRGDFRSPSDAEARRPAEDRAFRAQASELAELYEAVLGPPHFRNSITIAWDLRSVDRARSPRSSLRLAPDQVRFGSAWTK